MGVPTTCEKMDLDICGSNKDGRHRTIQKPKNLLSAA